MDSLTRPQTLPVRRGAARSVGHAACTLGPDEVDLLDNLFVVAPAAPVLPCPQLQIRCLSAATQPSSAPLLAAGSVARAAGLYIPAQGPLSTINYLRVSFPSRLPAAVLVLNPEIWLFTYYSPRLYSSVGGPVHLAGWAHPSHWEVRQPGMSWGHNALGAGTEFYGAAVAQSLASAQPYALPLIDSNHWLESRPKGEPRLHAQCERVRRFRFALVTDAPNGLFTASGKLIGPLSDEVWLGTVTQHEQSCSFHALI